MSKRTYKRSLGRHDAQNIVNLNGGLKDDKRVKIDRDRRSVQGRMKRQCLRVV